MSTKKIPARKDVPAKDKWNLSSIYKSDEEWEAALKSLPELTKKAAAYKGRMGESSISLLSALKELEAANLAMETVYHYASLQHEADEDDSQASDRYGRAMMAYTEMEAELSFVDPEIQEIDETKLRKWIELKEFADYRIYIEKLLHFKQYILSEKEERILSLAMQPAQTAETAFSVLTNVDMNKTFGSVTENGEEKPLTVGGKEEKEQTK
jgi:oligoendopeptidase F